MVPVIEILEDSLGIQLHPDSPIILVHCQDLKKIPRPSGLVSWIDAARLECMPTLTVLGTSTMGRTTQGSPSIAVLPPDEGAVLSEIASVKSAQFFSESRSCRPEGSGMDVSSAVLSLAVVSFPHKVILVDATSNLHQFFYAPVGCWAYPSCSNCSCLQLSGGCVERWCQVGNSCQPY